MTNLKMYPMTQPQLKLIGILLYNKNILTRPLHEMTIRDASEEIEQLISEQPPTFPIIKERKLDQIIGNTNYEQLCKR